LQAIEGGMIKGMIPPALGRMGGTILDSSILVEQM